MGKINKNNTSKHKRQFELFDSSSENTIILPFSDELKVNSKTLLTWRNRIHTYQNKIIQGKRRDIVQDSIFTEFDNKNYHVILGDIQAPRETEFGIEIILGWLKNILNSGQYKKQN